MFRRRSAINVGNGCIALKRLSVCRRRCGNSDRRRECSKHLSSTLRQSRGGMSLRSGADRLLKKAANEAAGERKPDAYPLGRTVRRIRSTKPECAAAWGGGRVPVEDFLDPS